MKVIYHFLGSVYFAIILLCCVALYVVVGTFIESYTGSHRYAAYFTYANPLFVGLLWGFFINILLSSLRRWPFRTKHIPFLITHFGLLMILGGVLIKAYFGVQGYLTVVEGSASNEILLPDTQAILLETRNPLNQREIVSAIYPVKDKIRTSEINLELLDSHPHSIEYLQAWLYDNCGIINNQPFLLNDNCTEPCSQISLENKTWEIFGGNTQNVEEVAKEIYLKNVQVVVKDTKNKKVLHQGLLKEFLHNAIQLQNIGEIKAYLDFHVSVDGLKSLLNVDLPRHEKMQIFLTGNQCLWNINATSPFLGKLPIEMEFIQKPALVLLKDSFDDLFFFAFDQHGSIFLETFPNNQWRSMIVYDQGFGGYSAQYKLPIMQSKEVLEKDSLNKLQAQISDSLHDIETFSPPLKLLYHASLKADKKFPNVAISFLENWENNHGWLLPNSHFFDEDTRAVLSHIDWNAISEKERKGCYWMHVIFSEVENETQKGRTLLDILSERQWPFLNELKNVKTDEERYQLFTKQVFALVDYLPSNEYILPSEYNARLLSAYLRLHNIHLSLVKEVISKPKQLITLESPLNSSKEAVASLKKLEDNQPLITVAATKGMHRELIKLTYDKFAQGIKWPILDGTYLVRFQPVLQTIPYKVRLRQARQINYINSQQAYSYESDLIVSDLRDQSQEEKTVSMNQVHETWDGYRFYLANITPPDEGAVKKVQMVVNHDPAKYWLTYPGALILTLGIVLLFWFSYK